MAALTKIDFKKLNLDPVTAFNIKQIIDAINGAVSGVIKYTNLDFTGSNLTSIITRLFTDLTFTGSNLTSLVTRLFTDLQFTGSNLTSIATRNHNDLQAIAGGAANDFSHLTAAQYANFTEGLTTVVAATYTVAATDKSIIANNAGTVTLTLPNATTFNKRILFVRTITANTVVSNASNVVPLIGGAAGTAILVATAGKWAMLHSDNTNWQTMAGN